MIAKSIAILHAFMEGNSSTQLKLLIITVHIISTDVDSRIMKMIVKVLMMLIMSVLWKFLIMSKSGV